MLMVIFGDGASFDSSPTYSVGTGPPIGPLGDQHNAYNRPPLAKELFANRPIFIEVVDRFPQCKTIVPRLRAAAVITGEKSIEVILQEIEQEAETYPRGPQELAAVRCYLQRAINECQILWRVVTRGITNYLALLREIERTYNAIEPVLLVTFNYDNLLEDALEALGYKFFRMGDYLETLGLFRVFKLHGSVNWAHIVENGLPDNINSQDPDSVLQHLIQHAAELRISNKIVLCNPGVMGLADRMPAFPAIAIPVENKNQFACPRTFVDHLTKALPEVSKILVIGWRATEANFLDLLNRNLRKSIELHVVAGPPADMQVSPGQITLDEMFVSWVNNRPPSPTIDPGGFTDFLESGRARSFLAP